MSRGAHRAAGTARAAGAVLAAGLAVLGVLVQPGPAWAGIVTGAIVTGSLALHHRERPHAAARWGALRTGGAVAATWLVANGVVGVLGPSSASVLVTTLIVGCAAAGYLRRHRRPAAPAVPPPAVVAAAGTASFSTDELCRAWRRTYLTLVDLPAGADRTALVAVRHDLLDELERRDAAGFRRWLDAGPRAGGDPARYLSEGAGG